MKVRLWLIALIITLTACRSGIVYEEFQTFDKDGWHKDSVLTFQWIVPDTASAYDVLLHVRHTEQYPYQNMWLFVDNKQDTIEFYLADDHGIWLGNKGNGHITMPVLYEAEQRFDTDTCRLAIRHGMRQEYLKGVTDLGVEVIKKKN
ncbi:MAG: gliding motility lipoprotein GldH [Paludibacteraceae bacterium]|nr:gliding motility lipoprotein GldH [Paludibacteraceae bacterium]